MVVCSGLRLVRVLLWPVSSQYRVLSESIGKYRKSIAIQRHWTPILRSPPMQLGCVGFTFGRPTQMHTVLVLTSSGLSQWGERGERGELDMCLVHASFHQLGPDCEFWCARRVRRVPDMYLVHAAHAVHTKIHSPASTICLACAGGPGL